MAKKISVKTFDAWISEQIHAIAPYAKTVKATDHYFATAGDDDVNVEFSRSIGGYSNHHFTTQSLREFYGASECVFTSDYTLVLTFN